MNLKWTAFALVIKNKLKSKEKHGKSTDRRTKQREGGCMHGQVTDVEKAMVRKELQYGVSA
jgi:hypothetical protein